MSAFGYGTFKQNVLEAIEYEAKEAGIDLIDAAAETTDVISHLLLNSVRRDEELKKLYERAKEDAKNELLKKMNSD